MGNSPDQGYKQIKIKGYAWARSCSEDDFFKTEFKAISPKTENEINGVVCSGFLKGSTVRIY